MKKVLSTLFLMCMMIFPMITNAEELEKIDLAEYDTKNLIETLESEEMEVKLKDYKESDDQVTIYLFRGTGCAYCRAFLTFLNELEPEYYNKIKVVSFDAWYDEASSNLLANISSYLGEEAGGVPYIIIGEQVFPGYAETYNDGIKAAIDEQYNAKEKINIFEDYNEYVDDLKKTEAKEKYTPVAINAVVTVLCTVVIIFYVSYSNSRLLYQLNGGTVEYKSAYDSYNDDSTVEYKSANDSYSDDSEEENYEEELEESEDEEIDEEEYTEEDYEDEVIDEEEYTEEDYEDEVIDEEEVEEEVEEAKPQVKKVKNNYKNTHKKSKRR